MPNNNFYITTPIYYVNDVPHIGHAYTSLACDVMARFARLEGKNVKYLTGTDEHGQKVEKSAIAAGINPQEFTDNVSVVFRKLLDSLNISNDDFIRTTEGRHKEAATKFWKKLEENGHIYSGKYAGWYSLRDEAFYAESEITEDGKAPTGAPVEWVEEESYFFDLSKWQDKLLKFYEENPDFIRPKGRRNEVISFVSGGLNDLSVSRTSCKWGIPVPGNDKHVMYVWLDALTNYISAIGYNEDSAEYKQFWPADVHVVGKDILRFHAVYWPAFLMAADLPLPKSIMAHGWWTNEGEKISKSIGNVIDPFGLINEFGLDNVRYFLMREVPFGNDGNFSRQNLVTRANSELANKIGNLLQRTASFIFKNCDSKIPPISNEYIEKMYSEPFFNDLTNIVKQNSQFMSDYNISAVLDNIIHVADQANIFIDKEAPWALRKTDEARMNEVLYLLMETLRYLGIMLQPFVPDSAGKMLDQLSVPEDQRNFAHLTKEFALKASSEIKEPVVIFPRLG